MHAMPQGHMARSWVEGEHGREAPLLLGPKSEVSRVLQINSLLANLTHKSKS